MPGDRSHRRQQNLNDLLKTTQAQSPIVRARLDRRLESKGKAARHAIAQPRAFLLYLAPYFTVTFFT